MRLHNKPLSGIIYRILALSLFLIFQSGLSAQDRDISVGSTAAYLLTKLMNS